jgi:hypothetical protein
MAYSSILMMERCRISKVHVVLEGNFVYIHTDANPCLARSQHMHNVSAVVVVVLRRQETKDHVHSMMNISKCAKAETTRSQHVVSVAVVCSQETKNHIGGEP